MISFLINSQIYVLCAKHQFEAEIVKTDRYILVGGIFDESKTKQVFCFIRDVFAVFRLFCRIFRHSNGMDIAGIQEFPF